MRGVAEIVSLLRNNAKNKAFFTLQTSLHCNRLGGSSKNVLSGNVILAVKMSGIAGPI